MMTIKIIYHMNSLYLVLFVISVAGINAVNQVFGRYGSVKVDIDGSFSKSFDQRWGSSWPEGIRLSNTAQNSVPNALRFHNISGYPYAAAVTSSSSSSSNQINILGTKSRQIFHQRKTFLWNAEDELVINCKLSTSSSNPSCTRIAPPISWFLWNQAKVNLVNPQKDEETVEIQVSKQRVENNLVYLRGIGMSREDIFRMLDKGPWILGFDISTSLPKLVQDLQLSLGLNQTQCKHVISHCPYLLAQYSRYKGRDVFATTIMLDEINYSEVSLVDDVMRFPVILATPPERIRGWLNLLQQYGIATNPKLFGKMLRRAPFMFYRDPPSVFDIDEILYHQSSKLDEISSPSQPKSTIVFEAKSVLDMLTSLNVPDLDKIIRTQPSLLMTPFEELHQRINFLLSLFSNEIASNSVPNGDISRIPSIESKENEVMSSTDLFGQTSSAWTSRGGTDIMGDTEYEALEMFHDLLQTYPAALSIDHKQMRGVGNALRASGLKRSEVVYIIKTYPSILQKSPEILQNLLLFLKTYCGFRKSDIVPSLVKFPCLLSADIDTLKPKVDYLYQSIGGTSAMLRRYPAYLSYDLDDHIKPRAEFLKAFNKSPAVLGLQFLVKSSPSDLAQAANVEVSSYKKFCSSFSLLSKKWKKQSEILQ